MAYTTIDDPSAHFKVQLYTGNGSANNAITFDDTDTDMQPDLVWIKNRDATDSHCLFDVVRGATKLLSADLGSDDGTAAETTDTDTLDSFASDGFQVDADVKVNTSSEKYVAWCWKGANGTASNTSGTLTTTVSANTTSGFSVVGYTLGSGSGSSTQGHGLGIAPHLILHKSRANTYNWSVYHHENTANPETDRLLLNETTATGDVSQPWNDTAPTSTLFTHGDNSWNGAGTAISYCFSAIQGFSKFGSYEGTGNADGQFVFTGFRPAFLMTKSIDSTSSWHIFDNKRHGFNRNSDGTPESTGNDPLVAEANTAEATTDMVDLLSNGFKFRIATDPNVAETYVYAAFAEAPFVNSEGVPCNAR